MHKNYTNKKCNNRAIVQFMHTQHIVILYKDMRAFMNK